MQHINLYLPRFQLKRVLLSAPLALAVWLVLVVSLLLGQWLLQRKNSVLDSELQRVKQEEAANRKVLETLSKEIPQKQPSPLLEQEVMRLEKERDARQGVLKALSGNSQGGRDVQFSRYLEALARQQVQGLWLTHIRISEGGRHIGVKGQTLESKLVPHYLQRLQGEKVFAGASFNTLELTRSGNAVDRLDFTLYSLSAAQQQAAEKASGKTGAGNQAHEDGSLSANNKAMEFLSKQLPGIQLIQKLHSSGDIPTLGGGKR